MQMLHFARRSLILTILCATCAMIMTIIQMFYFSSIVGQVFLVHAPLNAIKGPVLFLVLALSGRVFFVFCQQKIARERAITVKTTLRQRLFRYLLKLGPAIVRQERTGELVAVLAEGIERLDAYISRYQPQMILSVLIPLLVVGIIFPIDWISAFLLLITGPIIPLLMILVGSYTEQYTRKQWNALAHMSAHFLDALQGLITLKLFGRARNEQERIALISDRFRQKTMKVLQLAFLSGAVLEFMISIAIGLIAVVLGVRLLNHSITFEMAFFILLLTPEFYRPLRELGSYRHAGMEGKVALERMQELFAIPIPIHSEAKEQQLPEGELEIVCSDVSYTYPEATKPALEQVNLTLAPRTCTALIGSSGSGKTTLTNILVRFFDQSAGTITANGLPLHQIPLEIWREAIALVPQRPYLFNGTIEDNICLARPTATKQEVMQAVAEAGAKGFIDHLPQGMATEVGEQGVRLSAGQAQRIAIARALLKKAPFVIFDEPTSSLDPESEVLIRKAIEQLSQQRTVLVIAHRYNTIASAQQIVILEEGRLIECGRPEDLRKQGGAYARLLDTYREECITL